MTTSLTGQYSSFNRTIVRRTALLLLGALLISAPAEARRRRPVKTVRVNRVLIDTRNVFDPTVPGEDAWPYRAANAIHIRTQAAVIRRELLFHPGEEVSEDLLAESERNLRALIFVKDAKIFERPAPQGTVDLIVHTQDTWTLQPQINFGSEGGQSKFSTGIEEDNLFGYGKMMTYFYRSNPDGITHECSYGDPQLFNRRMRWSSLFLFTPTGNEQHLRVERPFYSLATRYAAGVPFDHTLGLEKVYEGGSEISRYNYDHLTATPFAGLRINENLSHVQRLKLQYAYQKDIYRAEAGTQPGTLPLNKTLAGPVLTWTLEQSDFIKETFIDKIDRVEDINLGHQVSLGAGHYGQSVGASQDAIPVQVSDTFGWGGDQNWFGLTSYGVQGRYQLRGAGVNDGRLLNTLYFLNLNYYQHLLPEFPMTGAVHLETAYAQNPDTGNPLSLGGDTGLRGFKVNAFTGNKSILLNLENRFFIPYEVLHVAFFGGAVFFDAGQVQPSGAGFSRKDFHANIGVGLRIGLNRTTEGTVYRFDVAYALGPVGSDDRVIVSITSRPGFKRAGNTYSSFSSSQNP